MMSTTGSSQRHFWLNRSVEIDAPLARVFALWSRYEDLPRVLESVRRTQRIDEHRVLWDVEIAGRQVVWDAQIVENVPGKRIRWDSIRGARHCGEVRFEETSDGWTRLTVEIRYEPRGFLERLGARWGLVDSHVRRDLARFRRFVESASFGDESASS